MNSSKIIDYNVECDLISWKEVYIMTWCHTGDMPLSKPMTTQCREAHIDGLVLERCNSSALAIELHLSCINPSICGTVGRWINQILQGGIIYFSTFWENAIITWCAFCMYSQKLQAPFWITMCSGDHWKSGQKTLNLGALKISPQYKRHTFQWNRRIFCAEFQITYLKFYTKYLAHTLKEIILENRPWTGGNIHLDWFIKPERGPLEKYNIIIFARRDESHWSIRPEVTGVDTLAMAHDFSDRCTRLCHEHMAKPARKYNDVMTIGNTFCITGHLRGESTSNWWFP